MPDVVTTVLLRLSDGRDLAKCAGVSRLWNKEAGTEKVWQHLVLRRWCVTHVKPLHDVYTYIHTRTYTYTHMAQVRHTREAAPRRIHIHTYTDIHIHTHGTGASHT